MRKAAEAAIRKLDSATQNKENAYARMEIWNSVFPENRMMVTTPPVTLLQHVLKTYLRDRQTDRFCFEISVLFLDLPDEFNRMVGHFPFPLCVACRIAYKVLYECFEVTKEDTVKELMFELHKTLRKEQVGEVKEAVLRIAKGEANVEKCADVVKRKIPPQVFDLFLEVLPIQPRLHLCFYYSRPAPKIFVDFEHMEMPFEFVQALCDINGIEAVAELIQTDDM